MNTIQKLRFVGRKEDGSVADQLAIDAANELERTRAALEYAYRIIDGGFDRGCFDMTVLKPRAAAFLRCDPIDDALRDRVPPLQMEAE